MTSAAPRRAAPLYYGWVIAGLTSLTLFFGTATVYSFGIFFQPLLEEFGGPRASLSAAYSLAMIVYGLMQLAVGKLFNRFSPRLIIPFGLALMGTAAMLNSLATAVWHLYLSFGVLLAAGIGLGGIIPNSIATTRWFTRRLGTALSLMTIGHGIGNTVMFVVISQLISSVGWRHTYQVLGGLLIIVMLPLNLIFMRESPEAMGLRVDGLPAKPAGGPRAQPGEAASQGAAAARRGGAAEAPAPAPAPPREEERLTLPRALRKYSYHATLCSYFVCGFSESTLINHLPIYAVGEGISPLTAGFALSLMTVVGIPAVFIAGPISDRVGRSIPLALAYVARLLGLLLILLTPTPATLYLGVFFFGLGYLTTIPLTTAIVGDLYGKRSHAVLFSLVGFTHQVGAMTGPFIAAAIFDLGQSYRPAFWLNSVAVGITAVGVYAIRQPRRAR